MNKIFWVLSILLGWGILLLERHALYNIFYNSWESRHWFGRFHIDDLLYIADDLFNFSILAPLWIIPIILIWIWIQLFLGKDIRIPWIFLGIMVCIFIGIILIFAYTMGNA